jgi:hypothetical protein
LSISCQSSNGYPLSTRPSPRLCQGERNLAQLVPWRCVISGWAALTGACPRLRLSMTCSSCGNRSKSTVDCVMKPRLCSKLQGV